MKPTRSQMHRPSLVERLLLFALAVLLVGLAINYAARLVVAVWPVLAICALVVGAVVALTMFLRSRHRGW